MKMLSNFLHAYGRTIALREKGRPEAKQKFQPAIAVSREVGSGGRLVAQALADKLGFQLCDKSILEQIATRNNVPKDLIELLDECPGRSLEIFGASLMRGVSFSHSDFDRFLRATINALLELGSVVIVGRGAVCLARPGQALRLRIVAPLEMRIRNYAGYEKITETESRKRLKAIEDERAKFMRRFFGRSSAVSHAFDLAINTEGISIDTAVEMSLEAYHRICKCKQHAG
ncbi:MAG: cytidylate kinase-like family protein [Candidatus Sumerlaeota bacterium]|nr:cytidylate kinase-like family protein [Candidatus Sumerlaeota bacterium]